MATLLSAWNFIAESAAATSTEEWAATVLLIVYVILAAREHVLCWPFGIAGSAISAWFYFALDKPLFMEGLLNVGYVLLGVYGWYAWMQRKEKQEKTTGIVRASSRELVVLSVATLLLGAALWSINHFALHAANAFGDAAIAACSVTATWMTARKHLQNWVLWIVTDFAAGMLYVSRGKEMYLFALLYFIYTILAVYGWMQWKKQLQQSNA